MKLIDWINIVLVITVPYSLWLEFRTNKRLRKVNKELLGRLEHLCTFCDKHDLYNEGLYGPRGLICNACAKLVWERVEERESEAISNAVDQLRRSEEVE